MKTLETRIEIDAPPARVWEVLTDLERYQEWNPFVLRAAGRVAVGERLEVRIQPVGGRAMAFRPRVVAVREARHFSWLGRLWGVPGLFDGTHRFDLEPHGSGTLLVHAEDFRGLLVPAFAGQLEGGSRAGFEAMNRALADRAAALAAGAA